MQNFKSDILMLEKDLKLVVDKKKDLEKQKDLIISNNEFILKEIKSKKEKIIELLKSKNEKTGVFVSENEMNNKNVKDEPNIYMYHEEKLNNLLENIQTAVNEDFHYKFSKNIQNLQDKEMKLKINYLVIKKLEIKESFIKNLMLDESEK